MFRGTIITHDGNVIRIYNNENDLIANIPKDQAKLIFNENEIPYMEEME
jgi:hypothetical protein